MKIATLTLKEKETNEENKKETNNLIGTDMHTNEKQDISVTCHKIIEWGLNKIIILGYSDGSLKVFDAPVKARDTVTSACTFSLQLCKNAITEIVDVDLYEFKRTCGNNGAYSNNIEEAALHIEEDGSFKWKSAFDKNGVHDKNTEEEFWGGTPLSILWEDWSVEPKSSFDTNLSSSHDNHNTKKESLYNYKQTLNPNINKEEKLQMAILVSTATTLTEDVKEKNSCHEEDNASFRPRAQSFAVFLRGTKIKKGECTDEGSTNDAMQMMKMASGHDMYLSMRPIIVWSRLEKVVRYIDIPMLIATTKEERKGPISKALFFMANQHQKQGASELETSRTNKLKGSKKKVNIKALV